jgi:hypothetical protein
MKSIAGTMFGVVVALAAIADLSPAAAGPRAIVELFTSQGCSSCPPADRILGDLAGEPSIIALTLPIDYWDYLGWKDTLADPRFTARQKAYSRARGDRDVFTPQMVVNGAVQVVGSDRAQIDGAIEASRTTPGAMSVPLTVSQSGKTLNVAVGPSGTGRGEVWICAVARSVAVTIARGENRGKQMIYHNVVRNWLKVGDFNGAATQWTIPLENLAREGVDAAVVFLQDGGSEKPGPMLGAAMTELQ